MRYFRKFQVFDARSQNMLRYDMQKKPNTFWIFHKKLPNCDNNSVTSFSLTYIRLFLFLHSRWFLIFTLKILLFIHLYAWKEWCISDEIWGSILILHDGRYFLVSQLPTMTADQPLCVTAKEIQWIKSDELRGKTLSCVIDDFDIENTFMKCLGM